MQRSLLWAGLIGFIVLLVGTVAIAAAQNPTPIPLQFLMLSSVPIPLGIWLTLSLLAGMMSGCLIWILRG